MDKERNGTGIRSSAKQNSIPAKDSPQHTEHLDLTSLLNVSHLGTFCILYSSSVNHELRVLTKNEAVQQSARTYGVFAKRKQCG